MKKAVIFDLNGVLILSKKLSDRFLEDFNVPTETFLPALKKVMKELRSPDSGSFFSAWEPYLKKWNIDMSEEELKNYAFSAENEDEEMVKLAKDLKENRILLIGLSNNFEERSQYYGEIFPFLDELFEKVYYSWQTGFIKPDKRAFELLFEENKLTPKDCVYFDDDEKNVDFGLSLGIESYLYKDPEDTRELLKDLL